MPHLFVLRQLQKTLNTENSRFNKTSCKVLVKALLGAENGTFPIELIKAFSQLILCSDQNLFFHSCLCKRSFHSIFWANSFMFNF